MITETKLRRGLPRGAARSSTITAVASRSTATDRSCVCTISESTGFASGATVIRAGSLKPEVGSRSTPRGTVPFPKRSTKRLGYSLGVRRMRAGSLAANLRGYVTLKLTAHFPKPRETRSAQRGLRSR